ncbi:hypothetical protein JHK84_050627 [Glycine max]|nr:hypothetical protein JHK86_050591 [Glycine max]KAG4936512.1 hypothetical protein JHK85_051431 [Glycine max]KAG5095039.1 hypothetical protein JHK84_050627 [Glycine max]
MGQQSLIYSFVARGTVILAEYTEFTGNFTSVAAQCLQKLPSSNNKFTYNCDGHTFNYLVDNGFTYCVVAVESAGRQIPIAFLERIKEDFTKKYAGGKAATAAAHSLNREFGPKLKEEMQYCVDHPEEISKLAKVKAQVSEVKGVMMENIEKVLDRGEKIELLVDKTENLRSQAQDFRQQGTKIRRKMWFQNMKIKLIVLGIIIALILIIVLSIAIASTVNIVLLTFWDLHSSDFSDDEYYMALLVYKRKLGNRHDLLGDHQTPKARAWWETDANVKR